MSDEITELTARVAELEAEKAALLNMEPVRVAREAEARATAAQKRIHAAQDRLTGILKSPDRKDPLELETCVDLVVQRLSKPTPAGLREEGRCSKCPYPPHIGPCTRRAGDTAYACLCTRDTLPATPEPAVTHAQLAAVVEEYEGEQDFSRATSDDITEERAEGRKEGAREVLRRATGGEVPEHPDTVRLRKTQALLVSAVQNITAGMTGATYQPGGEARLLAGLQALNGLSLGQVPEVLLKARVVDVLGLRLSFPGHGMLKPSEKHDNDMVQSIARDLGLTLPTPPSGPGGGEMAPCLHSEYQVGVCLLPVGHAGQHDYGPRSRITPTPTPDVPPLTPVPGFAMPPPAVQEAIRQHAQPAPSGVCGATLEIPSGEPVTPCDLPAGHNEREDWLAGKAVLHKGWCMGARMVWSAEEPAQPKPAAPEVVWKKDGVRVLADGTAQQFVVDRWVGGVGPITASIARALAEARREARKAAEDMRERAAKVIVGYYARCTQPRCLTCNAMQAAEAEIKALPLEDK